MPASADGPLFDSICIRCGETVARVSDGVPWCHACGAIQIRRRATEPLFNCDALGCERPADYAYIGESGDLYLCEFHGGAINVEGWTRITRENRDAE